ncbi:fibronectin type III domain-containing protein [Candidatus Parcubacteria bacterium]|nr:fibronectin type III domain-containing protein [Candidatus Parcubacteria bacterium]
MNKFAKTILIVSIAIFGAGLLVVDSTQAQVVDELVVEFEKTPLFDEADFKPGDSITRWVKVTNNSGQTQPIATEAINWPGFPNSSNVPNDDLSRALLIVIKKQGGSDLYGGSSSTGSKSLYNFYQDSDTYQEIYLSEVNNTQTTQYDFTISFPSEKENEWQEKTTGFDIIIGFQGTEGGPTPPSPPSPPGGGGGGGGLPPGLIIQYENTVCVSSTDAIITWLTSYNSTSRVIYDIEPDKFVLSSSPNYGYADSTVEEDTPANTSGVTGHTVEITGLSPNTDYYFRCISHASPPTIGTEHSFTTLAMGERDPCCEGTTEEEGPIALGEQEEEEEEEILIPEIIGEEEEFPAFGEQEEEEEEILTPEIIGEEGITEGEEEITEEDTSRFLAAIVNFFTLENYCWLLTLIGIILACLFALSKNKKKYYLGLIFGVIVLIILVVLLKCLFLIIPIVILIVSFLITLLKKKKQAQETSWS